MVAVMAITACVKQKEHDPGKPVVVHIAVDEEKVDVVDHYLEIDRRALLGVDKTSANKALAGDGPTAVAIGNAFADANHITEAHFWYRIAAENDDAIGMNNYSIAVNDFDCRRSIYWLKKAIARNELGEKTQSMMRKELAAAKANCDP